MFPFLHPLGMLLTRHTSIPRQTGRLLSHLLGNPRRVLLLKLCRKLARRPLQALIPPDYPFQSGRFLCRERLRVVMVLNRLGRLQQPLFLRQLISHLGRRSMTSVRRSL